jgi:hypothetical protein
MTKTAHGTTMENTREGMVESRDVPRFGNGIVWRNLVFARFISN